MSLTPLERLERRRRRRREQLRLWALRLALALVVFGLGVALGQALHDNPRPGGSVTVDRTVRVPSAPPGSTVTP